MASINAGRRSRRSLMAEINVVPYIDVMLVLLVIFMVTAPLLAQGVKVDLPVADAEPIPPEADEPVVVSVDASGNISMSIGEGAGQPLDVQTVANRVAAVLRHKPKTPVLVRGDRSVDYGRVVELMAMLNGAGVAKVGLITEAPETPPPGRKR